jgi:hypothetical protein
LTVGVGGRIPLGSTGGKVTVGKGSGTGVGVGAGAGAGVPPPPMPPAAGAEGVAVGAVDEDEDGVDDPTGEAFLAGELDDAGDEDEEDDDEDEAGLELASEFGVVDAVLLVAGADVVVWCGCGAVVLGAREVGDHIKAAPAIASITSSSGRTVRSSLRARQGQSRTMPSLTL